MCCWSGVSIASDTGNPTTLTDTENKTCDGDGEVMHAASASTRVDLMNREGKTHPFEVIFLSSLVRDVFAWAGGRR